MGDAKDDCEPCEIGLVDVRANDGVRVTTRLVVLVFGPRDMRLTRSQISPRFARLVSGTGATHVTVVHGDCRGVDRDCAEWAR